MELTSILISIVALTVSGFALYHQFLRPPWLEGAIGPYIFFTTAPPTESIAARFALQVIFINSGAVPSLVRGIVCRMTIEQEETEWLGFFERPNAERPNIILDPFIVPPRGTTSKRIEFVNPSLHKLFPKAWPAGQYHLEFLVIHKSKPVRLRGTTITAHLPRTDLVQEPSEAQWVGQPLESFTSRYVSRLRDAETEANKSMESDE